MAYRDDETDPIEVIIAQRRLMRGVLLAGLIAMLFPLRLQPVNSLIDLFQRPAPVAGASSKMTAAQVEERLQTSATVSGAASREHRCRAAYDGWDYLCMYRPDATSMPFQIGVRVGPTDIVQASMPYAYGRTIPAPTAANTF